MDRMPPHLDAITLLDGRHGLERLLAFTRQADAEAALGALAQGIQANPLWQALGVVRLVGRARPAPVLALFGIFSPAQRLQLQDLAAQLDELLTAHRYVDYHDAERAAEGLAEALRRRYGSEALSCLSFTAIPRGGWIVLGMLAYLLDLRPDQLVAPGRDPLERRADDEGLVVVDDCALSGLRFQQFLSQCDAARVIFCPLYANPALCRAIEAAEPRVEACLHAMDLQDVAPARFGKAYPQWLAERRARIGDSGYWCGIAEYVAFAWCEPQTRYWNAETERFEAGWNLLPPALSLKRRIAASRLHAARGGTGEPDVELLDHHAHGPLIVADGVLWTEIDSAVALARLSAEPSGSAPCLRLEETAADMWWALLAHGSLEGAEAELVARYAVPGETLRRDLAGFVAQLQGHGILACR